MADVWLVERWLDGPDGFSPIVIDSVWSSEEAAVSHVERDIGGVCEDPDYELVSDTCWERENRDGGRYVWFIEEYEVDRG